jgi:putative glutathione S-transferase
MIGSGGYTGTIRLSRIPPTLSVSLRRVGYGPGADYLDIKEHYFYSHPQNNPKRIVPLGPKLDIEPLDKSK